jgi:hypothetical protein
MVATVVVVGITLIGVGVAAPWAWRGPTASPSPPASPAGSPPASPSASPDEAWESVELLPLVTAATLEATPLDAAGIAPDATFALTSLTDEPAVVMAERITTEPPIDLDVRSGADEHSAVLAPRQALEPGVQYRVELLDPEGSLNTSWAFRVRSPVRVVSTIPGDQTTGVPVLSGIEVTFDQDGVADLRDHFRIEPAVSGRFERHGRIQVFVPDKLDPATLYTVTVTAGLARLGSDLALESDVVIRFETEGQTDRSDWLRFTRDTIESSPAEPPLLGVNVIDFPPGDLEGSEPDASVQASVGVYRLPSIDVAAATLQDFLAAPRWTEHTPPMMPIDGLPRVASFTTEVVPTGRQEVGAVRFPEALPQGWYIVQLDGRVPAQAFLQVTPVSAWVSEQIDRTVFWVNDVETGRPIRGASASYSGGGTLGPSDADGLIVGQTPTPAEPPDEPGGSWTPSPVEIVRLRAPSGETVLVPFGPSWNGTYQDGEWWDKGGSADTVFWSLLKTDRSIYRSSDTVGIWGYLRERDRSAVPPAVELRVVRSEMAWEADAPAVGATRVAPDGAGAFMATIKLEQVPFGSHVVQAVVDGRVVASRWIDVNVIRKPAYELALASDHRAIFTGSTVRLSASARFFDGTALPGLPIAYSVDPEPTDSFRTDATGTTSRTVELTAVPTTDDGAYWNTSAVVEHLSIRPGGQEEGEISADIPVLVYPASRHIDLDASLDGRSLRMSGSVDEIDLAAVETAIANGSWDVWNSESGDPDGAPVPDAAVKLQVTEIIPVRNQTGTYYDFIDKLVRPIFEYTERRVPVKTVTVRTDADGRLAASVTVPDPAHAYEVTAEGVDAEGRATRRMVSAGAELGWWWNTGPRFEAVEGSDRASEGGNYRIGDRVSWRIMDGDGPVAQGPADRFLYLVAQRGLRSVAVSRSSTFERTFEAADAPGILVASVRFTGTTYAPGASGWAMFDTSERALTVTATVDHQRYRPGEQVTVAITTKDHDGRPVPASVIVQAVDEKIFAMGGAEVPDPLPELYLRTDSGVVRTTATHQVPVDGIPGGGRGDTTGGRSDFRDTLAFRTVATDRDGRGTVTFRLSDDLTSWHVAVAALTADMQAGVTDVLVPVGLPVFVDATIADSYLVSDHPTVRLRAYGEALRAGDPVTFTIGSPSLGLQETRIEGRAFQDVDVDLPELRIGRHVLDISVMAPTRLDPAGTPLGDRLIRTIEVVRSRAGTAHSEYVVVGDALPAITGDELVTYQFTDAARGRFLPILEWTVSTSGLRIDKAIARSMARTMLVDVFGRDEAALPADTFDAGRYPAGIADDGGSVARAGVALLPYSSVDPWVAARIATLAPRALDPQTLRDALVAVRDDEATQRDLWIAAVAGLATLGEAAMEDLAAVRDAPDLTTTEQVYLGLGHAAAGDQATARSIERDLLERWGEQLGPWVRLGVEGLGTSAEGRDGTAELTALTAVLGARVGDPLAASMVAYVMDNPSPRVPLALEMVAAGEALLQRVPSTTPSFAYTIDGKRRVVVLEPGSSLVLQLSSDQRASLRLEPITGKVGIAMSWREPTGTTALPATPGIELTRGLPEDALPVDELVTVDLKVAFEPFALEADCYRIVEEVPSGLAPLDASMVRPQSTIHAPTEVTGQRVTWCVSNPPAPEYGERLRTATLRYLARVVNEGTFTWEPAVLQLDDVAEIGASTPAGTVTIGTP